MHFNKFSKYTKRRKRGGMQGTRFRGLGIPNPARLIKTPKRRRPSLNYKFPGISIAVLLAGLFFLAAVISSLAYMGNGERQAERILKKVYTVNQYQWTDAVIATELPAVQKFYKKKFGSFMTESGISESIETSLPYGLLQRHSPVDRTYAKEPELTERKAENGDKKVKEYTYYMAVDTYYIKGEEVVQPVAEEYYRGTIRIKKTGLFRWKLDGITGEQQQP